MFSSYTTSTSGILATGLKKWMPIRRSGLLSTEAISASGMAEVLVANTASAFMRGSMPANNSRFASASSKIASIMTSALLTPLPSTSAINLLTAPATRFLSRSFFLNNDFARFRAGSMNFISRSCRVTSRPRSTHQAAMSPPITPAPMTCTRRTFISACFPNPFNRSIRKNTRRKFLETSPVINLPTRSDSSTIIRCGSSP